MVPQSIGLDMCDNAAHWCCAVSNLASIPIEKCAPRHKHQFYSFLVMYWNARLLHILFLYFAPNVPQLIKLVFVTHFVYA